MFSCWSDRRGFPSSGFSSLVIAFFFWKSSSLSPKNKLNTDVSFLFLALGCCGLDTVSLFWQFEIVDWIIKISFWLLLFLFHAKSVVLQYWADIKRFIWESNKIPSLFHAKGVPRARGPRCWNNINAAVGSLDFHCAVQVWTIFCF